MVIDRHEDTHSYYEYIHVFFPIVTNSHNPEGIFSKKTSARYVRPAENRSRFRTEGIQASTTRARYFPVPTLSEPHALARPHNDRRPTQVRCLDGRRSQHHPAASIPTLLYPYQTNIETEPPHLTGRTSTLRHPLLSHTWSPTARLRLQSGSSRDLIHPLCSAPRR
jgi:hypothetical protein